MKLELKNLQSYLVLCLLSSLLVFIWFRNGNIMGMGESSLPFYNINLEVSNFGYSWAGYALGHSNHIITSSIPSYLVLAFIERIGIPGVIMQASYFWVILFASGVFIYLLTKELFTEIDNKYALLASLFYWFNTFSLVVVWNRFLNNYIVFFALLPGIFLYLIKGVSSKNYKYALLMALLSGIFSYGLSSVGFNIMIVLLLLFTVIFYAFVYRLKRERLFIIKFTILFAVSFILVNFWWIAQIIDFYVSSDFSNIVESVFASSGNLNTLTALSKKGGQLINITRLFYEPFFSQGPTWARFYVNIGSSVVLYLITIIIFWTIIVYRKTTNVLLLSILFLTTAFLMKGNNPPFGEVFQFFFTKIPFLQIFRNPFEKIGFLLPLTASPLIAFGTSQIAKRGKSEIFGNSIYFISFSVILLFLGYPFWSGLVFTTNEGFNEQKLDRFEVKVPGYYKDANKWLLERDGEFRFLSLPLGGEGMTYNWEEPYSGVELSSILFDTSSVSFNTSIPFYSDFVSQVAKYQLNSNVLDFLPFFSGKYIVLQKDIGFKERRLANPGVLEEKLNIWVNEGIVKNGQQFGNIHIFEVNDQWFWPRLYITSNFIYSNNDDLSKMSNYLADFPQKKSVVLDADFEDVLAIPRKSIISPSYVFPNENLSSYQGLPEEEILARLFYTPRLPTERLYPLIRVKEWIQTPPITDYNRWILFKTGLLGKRAVEVYKLGLIDKNSLEFHQAEERYLREFNKIASYLKPVIRGAPEESLMYQLYLLEKVDSKVAVSLVNYLKESRVLPFYELQYTEDTRSLIYQFEIPVSKEYEIEFGDGFTMSTVFLNGEVLDSNIVNLSDGIHEIGLFVDESDILSPEIEFTDKALTDSDDWGSKIVLGSLPSEYEVEFDYRFKRGDGFQLMFVQDIDRSEDPVFSQNVLKNEEYHDWRHWRSGFKSTNGAVEGELLMVPIKNNICTKGWRGIDKCYTEVEEYEVEIKNFRVRRLKLPSILLVSKDIYYEDVDSDLSWNKKNPSEYELIIDKNNSSPEILVFSDLFNSKWNLYYEDGSKIGEDRHFRVNVYANGWLINKPGNYKLSLKHGPQDLLNIGKSVSLISFFSFLIIVYMPSIRSKKKNE